MGWKNRQGQRSPAYRGGGTHFLGIGRGGMTRIPEAALAELKDRNPCDQVAAQWVTLRRHGRRLIGPCPTCSTDRDSRRATRFECDPEGFICAVCCQAGDVI